MEKKTENSSVRYTLNDDWKSFTIEELHTAAFHVVQDNSELVEKKLEDIIGKDKSFEIMDVIWSSMNVQPMDFVKRADPEIIAAALMDCNPKEVATVIRFIDNEKREKVLSLLSGEDGWDWRQAESHVERNIANMPPDEEAAGSNG
jgi:flagellar motor switch protein FliG